MLLHYWRDFDSLERYARSPDEKHWPAWTAFNRNIGNDQAIGIYYKTYVVNPCSYEAIYVNMPPTGLGKIAPLIPATGSRKEARSRMCIG